ncbi:MAG: SDR family oxidoreductase [bacterium]|nr:SDR family oxidoreductase [bacterium]
MTLLDGKIGLVTGGASGIGRAAALAMAQAGARIVVSDIDTVGGEETAAQIQALGREAAFVQADVSQADQVDALIQVAARLYGRIDCAFNNAGVGGELSALHEKTEAEWDRVIGINLKGVWLCMKAEIPLMLANDGGSIVNMASVAGLVGFRAAALYSASKHGVIGLTRSAALEYARRNIRVNAVCPYFTDTPMVQQMIDTVPAMKDATVSGSPMKRLGTPEETAAAVVWLCSDQASYITGHALPIDGGVTAS